ncbi:MAG: rhomboid family intramembrane serine protease [Cyclobacteriaceae bacterium]|nr:rhomboid family intramembrane serine protease [Cyclobacteriaceae bacterium]
MFRLTPMVKNILLINAGIFMIQSLLNQPFADLFGLRVVFADEFNLYQFLTYMWIHGSFGHLLGNMFAVLIFGPLLEQMWGSKRFLTFYLACGIGAGVLFGVADFIEKYPLKADTQAYMANPDPEAFKLFIVRHKSNFFNMPVVADIADDYYDHPNDADLISESRSIVQRFYDVITNLPMVGASGAVFGILMAFGMLFPNTYIYLYFAIPVKAKYVVFGYAMLEIYAEMHRSATDNVAHLAHIGGMIIAFVLLKIWQKKSNRFY